MTGSAPYAKARPGFGGRSFGGSFARAFFAVSLLGLILCGGAWARYITIDADISISRTLGPNDAEADPQYVAGDIYHFTGPSGAVIRIGANNAPGNVEVLIEPGVEVEVQGGITILVGDQDPGDLSRLEIQEGALLRFGQGAELEVGDTVNAEANGALRALGGPNPGEEVIFTAKDEPLGWEGIYFTPRTKDEDLNNCLLYRCTVSHGGHDDQITGLGGASVTIDNVDVILANCSIINGKHDGVRIINRDTDWICNPLIAGIFGERGLIADNGGNGIRCEMIGSSYTQPPQPYIVGNDFLRNGLAIHENEQELLYHYPIRTGAEIKASDFSRKKDIPGLPLPGPYIHDNHFEGNRFQAIQLMNETIDSDAHWVFPNAEPCKDGELDCVRYDVIDVNELYEIRVRNVRIDDDNIEENDKDNKDETVTLTIDPGTTITFVDSTIFIGNNGKDVSSGPRGPCGLYAEGTPEQRITFRGRAPGGGPTEDLTWNGIQFQEHLGSDGKEAWDIDHGSTLRCCDISNSKGAGLFSYIATVNLSCCRFFNNSVGIKAQYSTLADYYEKVGILEIACNDFNNIDYDIYLVGFEDFDKRSFKEVYPKIHFNNFYTSYNSTEHIGIEEQNHPNWVDISAIDADMNWWEAGEPSVLYSSINGGGIPWTDYPDTVYPLLDEPSTCCSPSLEAESVIYGEKSGWLAVYTAFATGDVNGDTIPDLIVAAPVAEAAGRAGAGEVCVYLGRAEWKALTIADLSGIDGPAPDVRILGQCPGDSTGIMYGVAVGDLDADGADDIVMSARLGQNCAGSDGDGKVFIVYGNSGGETWNPGTTNLSIDLASPNGLYQGSGLRSDFGADTAIYGPAMNSSFGDGLVLLTNIDGEAEADLVVSAWGAPGAGAVYAFKGASLFRGRSIYLAQADTDPAHRADITILGKAEGDSLGKGGLLDAGNFDGDANPDLVVGAYFGGAKGEIYIIHDVASIATPYTLTLANNTTGLDITTIQGSEVFGNPGQGGRLLVADMNNDGLDDLVIGVPNLNYNPGIEPGDKVNTNPGACVVVLGGVSGQTIGLGAWDSLPAGVVVVKDLPGQSMLTCNDAMDVGDVDGNGYPDLLLGDRSGLGGDDTKSQAGQAFLLMNPLRDGGQLIDLAAPGDVTVFSVEGAAADDRLGGNIFAEAALVKLLDVNGDGLDDVVLGAFQNDGPDGLQPDAGALYVFFGNPGLAGTVDLAVDEADKTVYGPHAGALLGASGICGLADFNGDGVGDLFWGAPLSNVLGASDAPRAQSGEIYIRFGPAQVEYSPAGSLTVAHVDPAGDAPAFSYDPARVTIDYGSGREESLTMVTQNPGVEGLNVDPAAAAGVSWQIETDRRQFDATVSFRYLDSEVEGKDESALTLYSSEKADKKFKPVKDAVLDTASNTFTVRGLKKFCYFVIMENPEHKNKNRARNRNRNR